MAKVSLRIYNREIESFIDQGNTNEAIAHCLHILRTFSKHLATYRLLGKAYLESKRYAEAVDIFGRTLMAVPDDFVSHVGLSIIRDEENKLDDAIWHMQRAFESQPSNSAIQGELQRLYGRRDGMEPPKIRMTRGALAQMYVQGELYPQAIAEIRAVLAQDQDRADMQVLLARAYFRAGHKTDATDICAQLLKRYDYCFDANRIMADLLSGASDAGENAQVYRTRVGELDPYAAVSKGSVFQSNEVADAAINLERLVYNENESQLGQDRGVSLGIGSGDSSGSMFTSTSSTDQPAWLKSGGFSDSQSDPFSSTEASPLSDSKSASQSSDAIPDFLRDAGWGESNSLEQPTSFFDSEPASGDLVPADIPDWMTAPASSNVAPPNSSQAVASQSIETPDWLSGLGDADTSESELTPSGNHPDAAPTNSSQAAASQSVETPDWLSGLGDADTSESELAQPGDVPDWLSGLDNKQPSESEANQTGNVPDWLAGLGDSDSSEPDSTGKVRDWLSGIGDIKPDPDHPGVSVENLGTSAQEQDDAVAWLESLATKHGAKAEELVTDPNKRSDTPPDWVVQTKKMDQQAYAPSPSGFDSTAGDQDDAAAWLDSLATKHGTSPEEFIPDPNSHSESVPAWEMQTQKMDLPDSAPSVESLGSTAQEQDDAMAWLESLAAKHGAKPEELVTDPSKRFDSPPEWVSQAQSIGEAQSAPASIDAEEKEESSQPAERVENALNIGEQYFAEFENASPAAPVSTANDETGLWLRNLEEKEKQNESLAQSTSDEKSVPDWLTEFKEKPDPSPGDIPEWLHNSGQVQIASEQINFTNDESVVQKSDLPNWSSKDVENSVAADNLINQELPQNDLSNWLSGLDDEPGLPFEKMPSPDSILFGSMPQVPLQKPAGQESISSQSDLPDWLTNLDSASAEPEEGLMESIAQEPVIPASNWTEETAPVNLKENLPDWLKGTEKEEPSKVAEEDPAPWLHRAAFDAKEVLQPTPTSPSDWHPVETKQPMDKKEISPLEMHNQFVPPSADPFVRTQPQAERTFESGASMKKKAGLPAKQRQPEAKNIIVALSQAKGELDRGDIPTAIDHYKKLIKKGKHLDETIRDLAESIYRYPVEVGIWQTLGDAYMRANRLKEALEAYNKAEELIR